MMHPDAEAALEDLKREFQIEIGGIVNDAIRRMRAAQERARHKSSRPCRN